MIVTVVSTSFYNNKIELIDKNYKNIINNIYFQKTITHFANNLAPRYKSIDHKLLIKY